MSHPDSPAAAPSVPGLAAARLAIGLLQGLALYALYRMVEGNDVSAWVMRNPKGYTLLCGLALLLPFVPLLGLGHLRARVLAGWSLLAAGIITLTLSHDLRQNGGGGVPDPSLLVCAVLPPLLFVLHNLIAAADASRRWWPGYAACFEAAWRSAIQLILAALFVGAFWAVFHLGASLFSLIGLDAVAELGSRAWFWLPVTGLAAAAALHLADVQVRLTRGARTLALTLLSWLTPLLGLLAACFLLAMAFTGPGLLWRTGYGGILLQASAIVLIVLINAVYQDGQGGAARPLRWAAHLAALVLPVLVALAAWGLALRIGQHGLTRNRVLGVALVVVLACYAVPYALAALRPGLRLLGPANIAAALAMVLVGLALNTPVADPNRLAVQSQVSRLLAGHVPVDEFDFRYLENNAGRYGRQAISALERRQENGIASAAGEARLPRSAREEQQEPPRVEVAAGAPAFPEEIRERLAAEYRVCRGPPCAAARVELGQGRQAWLVGPVGDLFWLFSHSEQDGWSRRGVMAAGNCGEEIRRGILAGQVSLAPAEMPDIVVAGMRLHQPTFPPYCEENAPRRRR
jgi:hypothetical protein